MTGSGGQWKRINLFSFETCPAIYQKTFISFIPCYQCRSLLIIGMNIFLPQATLWSTYVLEELLSKQSRPPSSLARASLNTIWPGDMLEIQLIHQSNENTDIVWWNKFIEQQLPRIIQLQQIGPYKSISMIYACYWNLKKMLISILLFWNIKYDIWFHNCKESQSLPYQVGVIR